MKSKIFFLAFLISILYSTNILAQGSKLIESQFGKSVVLGNPIIAEHIDSTDLYQFVFFTDDSLVNRIITNSTEYLYYQHYSGLPEYLPMKVCVRTKRGNSWSNFGDTCILTLTSDCSFMKEFRENITSPEAMAKLLQDAQDLQDLANTINLDSVNEKVIPVVFHVIVPTTFVGDPRDYLPPAKINEAIQILNEVYAGLRSDQSTAANCKIRFCPAMNYHINGSTMQSLACTDQGVTYYGITYNVFSGTDVNIPTGLIPYVFSDELEEDFVIPYQTYFPVGQYLSFFVFDSFSSSTNSDGYASCVSFPSSLSYAVLRREIIGTNSTITRFEGYTTVHESGHYFGLDHTWGGMYSTDLCNEGDLIDDTPPHNAQNLSCDESSNTCTADTFNDPVHNIMNYTNDGCRNHFTKNQAEWMHAVIQTYYTALPYTNPTAEGYDIYCDIIPCIEGASIEGPAENIKCPGVDTVEVFVNTATDFSISVYNYTTSTLYEIDPADISQCGANYCFSFNFATPGTYSVLLNLEASSTYSTTVEREYTILDCDTITDYLDRAHWHFDHLANLDFSTGIGQLGQTAISAVPAEVSVCSQSGELLFYTNGHDIWNRNHVLQTAFLEGNMSASKGMIALYFGESAGTSTYMMVYLDNDMRLRYRYVYVDSSFNITLSPSQIYLIDQTDLVNNEINDQVDLLAMGVSATPIADGSGYWLLSSLKISGLDKYYPVSIKIDFALTSVGDTIKLCVFKMIEPENDLSNEPFETTIKMSPNAKYVVYCPPYGMNEFFVFNAQTGLFNDQVDCDIINYFNKFSEVAFSKDSRYMYMTETVDAPDLGPLGMYYRIKQVDLEDIDICDCKLYGKTVFEANTQDDLSYHSSILYLQEGPDDRIYFSRTSEVDANAKYMGIILNPENAGTINPSDNECNTFGEFIHYPTNEWIRNDFYLPNFVDAKPDSCDIDFVVCSADCDELSVLNLSHGDDTTFIWNFFNGTQNYSYIGYVPQQIDTLPFSNTWTISLSKNGCLDTVVQSVSLDGVSADITGNDTICNDGQVYSYLCGTSINTVIWYINGNASTNTNTEYLLTGNDYSAFVGNTISIVAHVTNQFGCQSWDTLNVFVTGFDYDIISSLDCSHAVSGQVQINIYGETGTDYFATIDGYNYPVTIEENSPYTGLYPGLHNYTVSDEYCNYTGDFITVENLLVDSVVVSSFCPADSSVVTVYFDGGSSPYIVTYNSVTDTITENIITILGLSLGNFSFSVIDNFGCELDTTLIMESNFPEVNIYTSGVGFCPVDSSGLVIAVAYGGTPSYYYEWGENDNPIPSMGNGNLVTDFSSLTSTLYVTVTDENDCIAIDSLPLTCDGIYFDTIVNPITCLSSNNGGVEIFNVNTDLNIYPVFFENTTTDETLVWNGDPAEVLSFENLGTGTFTINYWNSLSLVNSFTFTIEQAWSTVLSGTITGTNNNYTGMVIATDQITVAQNAALTFDNCTVYTAYHTYTNILETEWIVNKAAKIGIKNTTIQAGCPQKWKGITVKGQNGIVQTLLANGFYQNHGYVIVSDNSVISDAQRAIHLQMGGVINAKNSIFINNEYSMYFDTYYNYFPPYQTNKSTILDNVFVIDSLLYTIAGTGTDIYQNTQIYIDGSRGGINLFGNTFKILPTYINPSNRGTAIAINSSKSSIKPSVDSLSVINGFNYGVKAQSATTSTYQVSVLETEFNHNVNSMYFKNYLAPVTEYNNINEKVIYTGPPTILSAPVGLYLEACDQYSVKLNTFKNGQYGAYIRNSGENYNLLYKNDFDSVTYPANANLRNSDFVPGINIGETGLEMKCNYFNHFGFAISVTGNMQQSQGADGGTSSLAGNRFDISTSTHLEREFIVSTTDPTLAIDHYDYFHHLTPICIPDLRTTNKVTLEPKPYYFVENDACPDNPLGGKSITKSGESDIFEIYTMFDDSISLQISDKVTELQQMIDNGNTLLLQAIAMTMTDENYLEAIEELDLNGMISDEVIINVMQNSTAPKVAKIMALIENSPLPKEGKDNIDKMTDVDVELRDLLQQYQQGRNTREEKEAEINKLYSDKQKNISDLIKYVAFEEDSNLNSRLIDFLGSQNSINANKIGLRFAVTNQNYHKADEILASIWSMSQTLDIDTKSKNEDYVNLQLIALNIERNYESLDSIVLANAEFLFEIANDTMRVECAQAQTLLEQAGLALYPPVVYPPSVNDNKFILFENTRINNNTIKDYLKIYPNPVTDNLFIEFAIFNYVEDNTYRIEVLDIYGKMIKSVKIDQAMGLYSINVRNLAPGNYLLKLNNKVIKFNKM